MKIFLSTPSARRATLPSCWKITRRQNFYPRPPRGGRHQQGLEKMWSRKFLSTPSARRATRTGIRLPRSMGNFYPRPPRGGRPDTNDSRLGPEHFYPRPPRGGRHKHLERRLRASKFLSTPSARRATVVPCCLRTLLPNFYPRPPRGGRPAQLARASAAEAISIHALREEGDRTDTYFAGMPRISIHALREEGDFLRGQSSCARANFYPRPPRGGRRHSGGSYRQRTDFYPRPPRGGRPNGLVAFANGYIFLSTPSARRATLVQPSAQPRVHISIHALREEGDPEQQHRPERPARFLSTPSARRATPYERSEDHD